MRLRIKHFLIGAFIGLGLLIGVVGSLPDDKLHLVFCDVGQGDAIYIKTPNGSDILIDGGPGKKVLDCLGKHMPFYDREIDLLILTHPDNDHLTGLVWVLERYDVKRIITENIYIEDHIFGAFQKDISDEGAEIYNPKAGDKIMIDGVSLNFLWPKKVIGDKSLWEKEIYQYANDQIDKPTEDISYNETFEKVLGASSVSGNMNDYSLVFLLSYNGFEALLTGDAEEPTLSKIVELKSASGDFDFEANRLEILKVPHHGAKLSLSTTLIDQLKPETAVISVGKNSYGHPREETLQILKENNIETKRTDQEGDIEIKF